MNLSCKGRARFPSALENGQAGVSQFQRAWSVPDDSRARPRPAEPALVHRRCSARLPVEAAGRGPRQFDLDFGERSRLRHT
jgi:hypothetical protein